MRWDAIAYNQKGKKIYYAWCTRSKDCSYSKRVTDTEGNRIMVSAMMRGHGNAHRGD